MIVIALINKVLNTYITSVNNLSTEEMTEINNKLHG